METLLDLKKFFETQLEVTLSLIKAHDSERLRKNKVNGFIIALQDKLIEIKPKLRCAGCGKAANGFLGDASSISGRETSMSTLRKRNIASERLQSLPITAAANHSDQTGEDVFDVLIEKHSVFAGQQPHLQHQNMV